MQSDLAAVMIAGSVTSLSRGFGQMLDLNAELYSMDPDTPGDKTVNRIWKG